MKEFFQNVTHTHTHMQNSSIQLCKYIIFNVKKKKQNKIELRFIQCIFFIDFLFNFFCCVKWRIRAEQWVKSWR